MSFIDQLAIGMQSAGAAMQGKTEEFFDEQAEKAKKTETRDTARIHNLLKNDSYGEALDLVARRKADLAAMGMNTRSQDSLIRDITLARSGDPKSLTSALTNTGAILEMQYQSGEAQRPPDESAATAPLTYMGRKVKATNPMPGGAVQYIFADGPPVIVPPDQASMKAMKDSMARQVEFVRQKSQAGQGARTVAKERGQLFSEYVDTGVKALDTYRDIVRAEEILDSAKTGGLQSAVVKAANLFGINTEEVRDFAALEEVLGTITLQRLQAFKGQMSNRELDFTIDTTGWTDRSAISNRARLNSIKRGLKNSISKGSWAAKEEGSGQLAPLGNKLSEASQFYKITPYGTFVPDSKPDNVPAPPPLMERAGEFVKDVGKDVKNTFGLGESEPLWEQDLPDEDIFSEADAILGN